jgi:hypothetical protein
VAYDNGFAAFHTGTDHHIYWSHSTPTPQDPGGWSNWDQIANNLTQQSPSVTQAGPPSSRNLVMAYRADGNDQRLWWNWHDGNTGDWENAQGMNGAVSGSAPTVAWANTGENNGAGRVYAAHAALNGNILLSSLLIGTNNWNNWFNQLGTTHSSPAIAVLPNNDLVVSHRSDAGNIWTGVFRDDHTSYHPVNSFAEDANQFVTSVMVGIIVRGTAAYLLLTTLANEVFWKQTYKR